jgi:septum site-determining protein MinD
MSGSVLTLAGGKGGVGKTTVAANVAVGLVKNGYDVAVVDGDLGMTNLDVLLDVDPDVGVHSVLGEDEDVDEATKEQGDGLTIVPGERGIETNGDADPAAFRRVVGPLAERNDIVLVDTGAGVNHVNCVAYGRADAVVLVTTPTEMAVINTKETRDLVERVDGTVAGVAVTRYRTEPDRPGPQKIADGLDTNPLAAIPEYGSFDPPEPRLLHAPESQPAQAYERLATALSVYHERGSVSDIEDPVPPAQATTREEPTEDDDSAGGLVSRFMSN